MSLTFIREFFRDLFLNDYVLLCKNLAIECYPNFVFLLCLNSLGTINLLFISWRYNDYLMIEAIGISNLYVSISSNIICVGIITGIEILSSNALGLKDYYVMGVYINKGKLISFIYLTIISVFNYFFSLEILIYLNINTSVIDHVKNYIYFNIFMMFFNLPFQINYRILNIVGLSQINCVIIIITVILHFFWCYLFIIYYDLGIIGSGITTIISEFICFILSESYIQFYYPFPESIFFINSDSLKGWKEYLEIVIPNTLYIFGEWMGFEIQSIFAVKMSNIDYTVHLIIVQIFMIVYSGIWSISMILTMKVAKSIVKDTVSKTLIIIKSAFLLVLINMIIVTIFIYFNREYIISKFSNQLEIISLGIKCIQLACIYFITSSIFFLFNSIFRGLAYNKIPTLISLINFYIIQTLITYIFGFYLNYGVIGIWISNLVGSIFLISLDFFIFINLDLKKYQFETQMRIDIEKEKYKKLN